MIDDQIIIPIVNPDLFLASRSDITGHALQRLLQPRPRLAQRRRADGTPEQATVAEALPPPPARGRCRSCCSASSRSRFVISRLTPADPLVSIVGERNLSNPESSPRRRLEWGLDQSIPVQYVKYMKNLLHGDLGTSFTHPPGRCSATCSTACRRRSS